MSSDEDLKDKIGLFSAEGVREGIENDPLENPENYSTSYSFSEQDLSLAVDLQVAKRTGSSLSAASKKFDSKIINIASESGYNVDSEDFNRYLTSEGDKPFVYLVNCNAQGKGEEPNHWLPVILHKGEDGEYKIDVINSESDWNHDKIKTLAENIGNQLAKNGLKYSARFPDRHVQYDDTCGLSCADAVGIAVDAIEKKEDIAKALADAPDQIDKAHGEGKAAQIQSAYTEQGREFFKLAKHLKGLEDENLDQALSAKFSELAEPTSTPSKPLPKIALSEEEEQKSKKYLEQIVTKENPSGKATRHHVDENVVKDNFVKDPNKYIAKALLNTRLELDDLEATLKYMENLHIETKHKPIDFTAENRQLIKEKLQDRSLDWLTFKDDEAIKAKPVAAPAAPTEPAPSKGTEEREPVLVCIDFDFTAVDGHTHATLANAPGFIANHGSVGATIFKGEVSKDREAEITTAIENSTSKYKPKGIREGFVESVIDMIQDGQKVAITSFSEYPDAIQVTLKSKLEAELKSRGLDAKLLEDNFVIVAGNPSDKSNGKLNHMEKAREYFDLPENCKKMLVEDDGENCHPSKLPKNTVAINIGIESKGKVNAKVPKEFWQSKVVQTSRALSNPPEMPPRSLPTKEHITINEQEVKEALYAIALESDRKRPKVKIEGGKAMLEFESKEEAEKFRSKPQVISEGNIYDKGDGPDAFARESNDRIIFLKKDSKLKGQTKEKIQEKVKEDTGIEPTVKIYESGIIALEFDSSTSAANYRASEAITEASNIYEAGIVPDEIQLKKSAKHIFLKEAALTELDAEVAALDKEELLEKILATQAELDGGYQTDESQKEVQLAITLLQEGTNLTKDAKRYLALQNTQEITADALYETTLARIAYIEELKEKLESKPDDKKLNKEIEKIRGFISEDIKLFAELDGINQSTRLQEMALHQDKYGNTIAHLLAAYGEMNFVESIQNAVPEIGTFENKSGQKVYDIKENYKDADRAKRSDKLREKAFKLANEGKDKALKNLLEAGRNLNELVPIGSGGKDAPYLYDNGKNILHLAAEFGLKESASYILTKKPKLMAAKDASGQTPIDIAQASSDKNQVFEILLSHAADMEEKLFNAVSQGESHQALDAMNKGANPAEMHPGKFDDGQNLLHLAAANSPKIGSEVIQRIIDSGIDVNSTDINGNTPAHILARSSYGKDADKVVEIMQALSEAGADLRLPNSNGLTALDILEEIHGKEAAQEFTLEATKTLLQSPNLDTAIEAMRVGGDVNHQDKEGKTPLMHALERENTDLAQALISNGADLTATTRDGRNALHFAAAKGEEYIKLVTLSNAWNKLPPSKQAKLVNAHGGADKATPLHSAADDYTIRDLRYRGAYVDALDANGNPPIKTINPEIAFNLLRTYEGKPGSKYVRSSIHKPEDKDAYLIEAILEGKIDNIGIAVADGASVQTRPNPKTPLLHYALTEKRIPNRDKVVESLVNLGANVNEVNSEGKTPLMVAIENGHLDSAKALLKSPEIDVRKRALHKAKILESDSGRSERSEKERTITQMAKAELALYEKYLIRRESRSKTEEKSRSGQQYITSPEETQKKVEKANRIEHKLNVAKTKVESLRQVVATLEVKDNEAKLAHLARIGRYENAALEATGKRTTIKQLLKNYPDTNLEPALFAAAQNGKPQSLSILLEHHKVKGSKTPLSNMRNAKGQNLFEVAKEKGFKESMKVIAQAHQGPGEEPLVSREMINELLLSKDSTAKSIIKRVGEKKPSAINAKDPKTGNTLLQDAIEAGNTKAVEKLLTMDNVDIRSANTKCKTALHLASELGDKKLVKAIMDRAKEQFTTPKALKEFVETPDEFGRSAIHLAAKADATKSKSKKGSKEIFKLLLEDSHAEPAKRDYLGNRPIDYAESIGHSRSAEGLVEYGSPDITGATLIEEALMKGERSRLDRMRGKGSQIEEATKLFEKFYPEELYPEKYSKTDKSPKFMSMAAENGRKELLTRLSQDPYLREEDGKITNKEDLLEAARIAAMKGNVDAIEIMRDAILYERMTIIPQELRETLKQEFDKIVEDTQKEIEQERERVAEIAMERLGHTDEIPMGGASAGMPPASTTPVGPRSGITAPRGISASMAAARSLAEGAAAASGTLRPHNPLEAKDKEFSPEVKKKFLETIRDGIHNINDDDKLRNQNVINGVSDLASDVMKSGKAQNCTEEATKEKDKRKIFSLDLSQHKSKTIFFPKFDSKGMQIKTKDSKPVFDMLVIDSKGEILAGTLTHPTSQSSMPDKFIDQVKAINAPAKSLAAARSAAPTSIHEKTIIPLPDEQEVQIVWHRAREVSQALKDIDKFSIEEEKEILDGILFNIDMTLGKKIENMQKKAESQKPQFDEKKFNEFLASSKPTSLPEGINEAGILQEIETRRKELYTEIDRIKKQISGELELTPHGAAPLLGGAAPARADVAEVTTDESELGMTSDKATLRRKPRSPAPTADSTEGATPPPPPPPPPSPGDEGRTKSVLKMEAQEDVVHYGSTVAEAAKMKERLSGSDRKPLGSLQATQQEGSKLKTPWPSAHGKGKENRNPGQTTELPS